MKKAGGILGIIGGVFGVFAALTTLLIGGMGGAFNANGADTVIGLGWGGLAFSFLCIIFGAVSLGTPSRVVGVLLTLSALGGVILGGTMVAVCMALALVGGVLATWRGKPQVAQARLAPTSMPKQRTGRSVKWVIALAAIVVIGLGVIGLSNQPQPAPASPIESSAASQSATGTGVDQVQPSSPAVAAPRSFRVGEPITTPTFRVAIQSVAVLHSVGQLITSTAPAGAEYVAVSWAYTSLARAPVSAFAVPSLHLMDAQGHAYDADLESSGLYAAQLSATAKALSNVNPGITLTDGDIFEVSTALFNPTTWKLVVRVDGQDFDVRLPQTATAQTTAPVVPESQPVAAAPVSDSATVPAASASATASAAVGATKP